jgi:choline-sulfatase
MNMRKRWIVGAGGAAAVALAAVLVFVFANRKSVPLNLLLISVDTLRPDHLGAYGYKDAETPAIDRLAREGVTFDDVISSVPLTLPSHASMLTGLSPLAHGVRDNANFKLGEDFVTLAEVLRANSYSTFAAVGAFVLNRRFGVGQGFASYDDDMSKGRQPSDLGYPERTADRVSASALTWLGTAREPFMLFLHYYDPHYTYDPPAAFRDVAGGNLYDGEIAFTDQEIGKVIAYLRERRLLARTLVVFTSDHGEGFNEHGEETHGLLLYNGTLKVPLIIRVPERSRLAERAGKTLRGTRQRQPVQVVDIFPTVLDILGYSQMTGVDGRSLVPMVEGKTLPPVVAYFESMTSYFAYRWCPLRGVRFNEWKYIFAPEEELYDVVKDPGEAVNLAAANRGKTEELKAALFEAAREEHEVKAAAAKLNAREARQLRALGYASPSAAPVPEITNLGFKDPNKMVYLVRQCLEPGTEAYDRGDFDTAMAYFKKFIEADPANPEAQAHLARALMAKKDYPAAIAAYNRLLELDSLNSGAYFNLGVIAQAVGDPEAAIKCYEKAIELVPASPEGLANLGGVLLEEGQTDSAMVLLEQAIDADPRCTTALINLGLAYSSKGLDDAALEYFKRLLKLDPTNLKALSNAAAIYVGKGAVDSAVAYFERAADTAPNDARTLVNLGGAYRQKGQLDKAAAEYEKAVRLEPVNVLALFGLAGARAAQGRRDEARALVAEVLRIDPAFQPALDAAERLK